MAKYYVFHYSEVASKNNGKVYCNIDFIPDNDKERVLKVSVSYDILYEFDSMKGLDPNTIKKYWYDVYYYFDNQYKQYRINGIQRLNPRQ